MIASIEKQEKELFNEWRKTTPNLSEDGIVEPKSYLNADIKILFLLKEVNSKEGFNLKEFVRNGGRTQTWDNIARWTCGIHNWKKDFIWDEIEPINIKIRKEWLRFISVMNIKKTPGGHTSNYQSLWEDSAKDKEFLNRQFKLYYNNPQLKPDFIIACGTQTSNFFHTLIPFAQDKLMDAYN